MIDLEEIQTATNLILANARTAKDIKGVNWGDLSCVDVMECRSVYGDTSVMVLVEECSPDSNLRQFIYKTLHATYPDICFDVRTEW